MQGKPLSGLRVLDFTRLFAGPFCTMLLGDLGADVVKVESPGGDPIRRQGPPFHNGMSMGYLAVNRNKRSLVADLKDTAARDRVLALMQTADVVVENFRPGVMERLGLGPAALTAANPKLVYTRISGMGSNGPLRDKGAFDLTIQAEAGFMSITGESDGPPIKLGTSVFDLVCGQYAMGAILAALLQRAATGKGTVVETSLYEGVVSFLTDAGMEWLLTGRLRDKLGSEHSSMVPYRAFRTSDGWAVIAAAVQDHFVAFADALGLSGLANDPRFRQLRDRVDNRKALDDELNPAVARFTTDELIRLLDARGIPCAAVNTIDKVFGHEQARARGMTVRVNEPDGESLSLIGPAVKYGSFDITKGWRSPPPLGADTQAVFDEWLDGERHS